jgi:hypothetical protein
VGSVPDSFHPADPEPIKREVGHHRAVAPETRRPQRHATASKQVSAPRRETHSSEMRYATTSERLPVGFGCEERSLRLSAWAPEPDADRRAWSAL